MNDIKTYHSYNANNESQIYIVLGNSSDFKSSIQFHAAAIRVLRKEWESDIETTKYIAGSTPSTRSCDELVNCVNKCLISTPFHGFALPIKCAESVYSFHDQWNSQEIVWRSINQYVLLSWDTAA